jgi:hypothetical protein
MNAEMTGTITRSCVWLASVMVTLMGILAGLAGSAASAQAAPALGVTLKPIPAKFPIDGNGAYNVKVDNVGDAAIPDDGSVTLTLTLPPELTATGYAGGGAIFPIWTCAIAPPGQLVTCTGPGPFTGPIAAGASDSSLVVNVAVAGSAQEGPVTTDATVQVCGGGAPACAQDADATPLQVKKLRLADSLGALPPAKAWWAGTCDLLSPATAVGTAPASARDCIDAGEFVGIEGAPGFASPNPPSPWLTPPAWRLGAATGAGAHPDASANFTFEVDTSQGIDLPAGKARSVLVDVPAGVVGSPTAIPRCTLEQFAASPHQCPASSQIGVSHLRLDQAPAGNVLPSTLRQPVYNLEARDGFTAEFGIPDIGTDAVPNQGVSVRIFAKARTEGDFGVTTGVMSIPTQFPLIGQTLTFWGVPWASSHDLWRKRDDRTKSALPVAGLAPEDRAHYAPSWGAIRPFFSNPTECSGSDLTTTMTFDAYESPGDFVSTGSALPDATPRSGDPSWTTAGSDAPPVATCDKPPFDPSIGIEPTSSAADAASGLKVDLTVPQNDDPPAGVANNPDDATGAPAYWKSDAGRATSQLDKTVVTLPDGMTVNPSAAAGLEGCTDAEIGVTQLGNPPLFDNSDPLDDKGDDCPDGSVIGTVDVKTPLLDEHLTGQVILGMPKSTDPNSGEMFRLFLVVRSPERGLIAKIYGSSVADPNTGVLKTTFDNNPRVPFETLHLEIKGGERGVLGLPQRCGSGHDWTSDFAPWTAAHGAGGVEVADTGAVSLTSNCGFGFAPDLLAAGSNAGARKSGTFSFRFTRDDGEQWFRGLTAHLPRGLLASVKDLPLCKDAEAAAGACPAASRIGTVDAGAGSGDPFFLEQKGDVFLTEGYKGGPYGLMVKIRVIAGPFRGPLELSPIVVRQKIEVDRQTAAVRAISDPFPLIHHGVPLRARQVQVNIDRSGFMLNPSNCSQKQTTASLISAEGTTSDATSPFNITGCSALPFKPTLALSLTGRKQTTTGKHPGVKAVVTQAGVGEAGVGRAEVRLPKSLALDPSNAQALCEFEDGTKDDLESRCPKGSIVGRARATTPLLNRPLVGNVYFVKNVRIDPTTGNAIRTLPMIVVALRGEIAINLKGESSTTKGGKLVNTFASVPDAPISQFNLNIAGGKNGILAVTRTRKSRINICSGRHVAEADFDGQNGKTHDLDVRMKVPCSKKQKAAAKRAARKRGR